MCVKFAAEMKDLMKMSMEIIMLVTTPLVILFCIKKVLNEYNEHKKRKKIEDDE